MSTVTISPNSSLAAKYLIVTQQSTILLLIGKCRIPCLITRMIR